jgi:hypothetical protein
MPSYYAYTRTRERARNMLGILPAAPSVPESTFDFAKLKDIIAKRIIPPAVDTAVGYTVNATIQPVVIVDE